MRESPLGAIGWGVSRLAGGSPEAQQMWLDIGTSADGFAMAAAALGARSPAYTGARGMPELVGEPKLFAQYEKTRTGIEREMFRTPGDELSVIISRKTGQVAARELLVGSGGRLAPETLQAMRGNTFTHFHPDGGNFSVLDFVTSMTYEAAEMRAVMNSRTLSINFERAPVGLAGNPAAVYEFMRSEQSAIGQSYRAGVANGTITPPSDAASKGIWKSNYFVNQIVQRNNWMRYTETRH